MSERVPFGTMIRRKLDRFRRKRGFAALEAAFRADVKAAGAGVCIDLGANVGEFTKLMAIHGAQVYAFEPDPWAAEQLRANTAHLPNVEVIEAAAGTKESTITLYRAADFADNPGRKSKSSSMVAGKRNVDPNAACEVRLADFPAFLRGLERDVDVIKMDIEGAEVELLEALLDDPVCARIGAIYVETHETKVPALADRSEALRTRVAGLTRPRVNMEWK